MKSETWTFREKFDNGRSREVILAYSHAHRCWVLGTFGWEGDMITCSNVEPFLDSELESAIAAFVEASTP